jgi:amidase
MRASEYAEHDATGLARLISQRQVSAGEVRAAALAAIEAVDSELHAIADGPWEQPLAFDASGPFGGVPFVLKDLGAHPQRRPVRSGTRLAADGVVFEEESWLVGRFRAAGLAILASTTVSEFGLNGSSEALAYGPPTCNPWNLAHSAGGSSGGTSALVAAGVVPAGHANDGGGSIRIPAAFNGLVGLKPSRGRITSGPDLRELVSGIATEGAITRTMRDTAALLDAIAGAMPGDLVLQAPARPWAAEVGADPGRLRIGVQTAPCSGAPVDAEVVAAVDAVAQQLEALGHHVEPASPALEWEAIVLAALPIFSALVTESVDAISAETGLQPSTDTLELTTLACYEYGRRLSALDLAKAFRAVNQTARAIGSFFASWDLLLTPTMRSPAVLLGQWNQNDPRLGAEDWFRDVWGEAAFTLPLNFSGTPAISLPLGMASVGLPIGVQLAAPMCDETTLIRVGSQLETAMPWHERLPAVHAAHTRSAFSSPAPR